MSIGLVTSTHSFEMILAGVVTTNQLPFMVTYNNRSLNQQETFAITNGQSNNAAAVVLLDAPQTGQQRIIETISIYNADTVNATVTVRLNDAGTTRIVVKATLVTGTGLHYEDGKGWYVQ